MNIFSAMKSVEVIAKSKCLSCEGEIITFLFENGPSRSGQIVKSSRHSHVHVYNKLRDLSNQGVLDRSYFDNIGHFVYKLSPLVSEILDQIEV